MGRVGELKGAKKDKLLLGQIKYECTFKVSTNNFNRFTQHVDP